MRRRRKGNSVVTPPTRERAGFLRAWLGRVAEGRPGPVEDVRRADVVRVGGEAARRALELGLGEAVVRADVPAASSRGRAGAGGVAGVHRDHEPTGAFSL